MNRKIVNAITVSLEALIGSIYTDIGATVSWVDSISVYVAGYLNIAFSGSIYIVASLMAALVVLVKGTLSGVFMVVGGVQVCIGLAY